MYRLYYKPACPFSRKVLDFAEEAGISLDLRDVRDPEVLSELVELTSKQQIPFLVDTEQNVSMPESADIIEYLRKSHYSDHVSS